MIRLDQDTAEELVAEIADAAKNSPEGRAQIVALLAERLALYTGRSSNEVTRMRGYLLAAFEETGLPEAGLPYVLEELESGHSAYLVAAAAKAVRGLDNPTDKVVQFLLKAVENVRVVDDAITFDAYKPHWPLEHHTTALTEIFKTLAWLGADARSALPHLSLILETRSHQFSPPILDEIRSAMASIGSGAASHACCDDNAPANDTIVNVHRARSSAFGRLRVALEDQDGKPATYQSYFTGTPAVIAFFYTRCDNPNKCSLTVTKLARLQRLIHERGLGGAVKTAGITYDPQYDLPARLKAYGHNRGMRFTRNDRMFRTLSGFEELCGRFELGVNFSRTTVNRHRIESFVVDAEGEIAATFTQLQWEIDEVLNSVETLLAGSRTYAPGSRRPR